MSDTSAIPSQRGDKYQDYYALFLMLNYLNKPNDRQKDLSIKIEGLDDIELSLNGKIYKLIQTKYITTGTPLTDSSTEFWKTIGIWSNLISENEVNLGEVTFYLVTTTKASFGHAPKLLNEKKRSEALIKMEDFIAQRKENLNKKKGKGLNDNEKAFLKFEKLDNEKKLNLLESTIVLLEQPDLNKIKIEIKSLLGTISATREEHLNKYYDDIIDWWIGKIGTDYPSIHLSEIRRKIADLRDKFPKNILPTSYEDKDVSVSSEYNEATFIKQLHAINGKYYVEEAKQDYHKAYLERSYWQEHEYISPEDIISYQEKLIRKGWKTKRNSVFQNFLSKKKIDVENTDSEDILQEIGYDIYDETMNYHIPIQDELKAEYVMKGSYHELADREKIQWHPKFSEWLKKQG